MKPAHIHHPEAAAAIIKGAQGASGEIGRAHV